MKPIRSPRIRRSILGTALPAGLAVAFLLAGAGTCSAATAAPQATVVQPATKRSRAPFTVALLAEQSWPRSDAYRLFASDESSPGYGLLLGYDFAVAPRLVLAVNAEWQHEETSGRWTSVGTTNLSLDSAALGLQARVVVHRWVQPYVRVAAGLTDAEARLNAPGGSVLSGSDWKSLLRAGAGVMLRTDAAQVLAGLPPFAASLSVEGGFASGRALEFAVSSPATSRGAEDPIPVDGVTLGKLSRSRPYLRFTFAVHF